MAFKIDLRDTWWSTRLFHRAALAEKLTEARRILVVERLTEPLPSPGGSPPAAFVGQISTAAVMSTIGPMSRELGRFRKWLDRQPVDQREDLSLTTERYMRDGWVESLGSPPDVHEAERRVKVDLSRERLRRWFGDALLHQPVLATDLERASVVDLMRILDYPNDFVPVLSARVPDLDEPTGNVEVIDRSALTARLAQSYLNELKERARID